VRAAKMKLSSSNKPKPGNRVLLTKVPPGFLRGLPKADKKAISEIVGRPILLVKYDDDERAELEFTDANGVLHFIYVKPSYIKLVKQKS
jgi:hypothetical protein